MWLGICNHANARLQSGRLSEICAMPELGLGLFWLSHPEWRHIPITLIDVLFNAKCDTNT
jgi:hypothetical protein